MTAWALVAAVVATTVVGDALQAYGMRHGRRTPVALSMIAMAASFFAFLELLSEADVTFAVPATAAYIVLDTVVARAVLKERVNAQRWLAAALVACGVALLAL